jgi:hypothetical protein
MSIMRVCHQLTPVILLKTSATCVFCSKMLHGTRIEQQGNVIPILTGASRAICSVLRSRSKGVTIMTTDDKSQMPSFSPKDEKKAQQRLALLRKKDEKKAQKELALFRRNKKRGFEGKTSWDWLQLLGVPILLAFATIFFGFVQFYLSNQQHVQDQILADRQHFLDKINALDQQRATTLETYIDNIQELMLKDNLPKSKPTDEVAILARARTLTALQVLDDDRKTQLVQFLYEAQLIGFRGDQADKYKLHNKIIDLMGADLSYTHLSGADLRYADFSGADLRYAELSNAILIGAILIGANLYSADLHGADLRYAILNRADLRYAELYGANLYGANLSGADLSGAELSIIYPNLSGAHNLTQEQLDQVYSCYRATLPTGLTCHHNQ